MKRLGLVLMVWLGHGIAFSSRLAKKGRGTSLPGLLIEKRFIWLLKALTQDLEEIICISGTNGKTTTRAVLVHMYQEQKVGVCTNLGGANLIRGLASSLLLNRDWLGRAIHKTAILEVEEASLPRLACYVSMDRLILTNIFRDQLDAYGEIDKTYQYFTQTLTNLAVPTHSTQLIPAHPQKLKTKLFLPGLTKPENKKLKLILNLDDGYLTPLLELYDVDVAGFKLDVRKSKKPKFEKEPLPDLQVSETFVASNISASKTPAQFTIASKINSQEVAVRVNLPGIFNVYNVLAAYTVAQERFGLYVADSLDSFEPVFGRGEEIRLGETKISLYLVKNPTGFDQVIEYLQEKLGKKETDIAICINDNIADGRDVSWLWDIELEKSLGKMNLQNVWTGGSRGVDILVRLQYAGIQTDPNNYFSDTEELLDKIQNAGGEIPILCTYTAMLELRKILQTKVDLPEISQRGN
jgi:lipid II isoglutaminyl synthase (glutamine-hydrolysing)